MKVVVIGGSSGLGLELATRALAGGAEVYVTGRTDPKVEGIHFYALDLGSDELPVLYKAFFKKVGHVDKLILSAGFFQGGKLDELSDEAIETMLAVGARAPIYAVREVLRAQKELSELVMITSTSQFVARVDEPVYNFVKAGAGHFTRAMAEDARIQKVLLVAPGGMQTGSWRDTDRDTSAMLDPKWVADQIDLANGGYTYRFIKIFREPRHVEEVETIAHHSD